MVQIPVRAIRDIKMVKRESLELWKPMMVAKPSRTHSAVFTLCLLLTGGCNMSPESEDKYPNEDQREQIVKSADAYIKENYKWKLEEYRIDHKPFAEKWFVAWAIFLEDERNPMPGSGKSLILHVSKDDYTVIKVLRFQ